jgi:hypothetical protein
MYENSNQSNSTDLQVKYVNLDEGRDLIIYISKNYCRKKVLICDIDKIPERKNDLAI